MTRQLDETDLEYWARRRAEEEILAERTKSAARAVHEAMAVRYATRIADETRGARREG